MGKIVIFGATGTVGVYTTVHLKSLGHEIIAVGHRKSDNGFFSDLGIPYYSVDISQYSEFDVLPQYDIDCILHFAGAMPARMKNYNPHLYLDSIITGTLNVLEYARNSSVDRIVFTQSISDVLYLFGKTTPIKADSIRKFPLVGDHSVYSLSKNAAVDLVQHYHAQYGIKTFILRLPTIYVYHPNPFYYVNGVKHWMGYRYMIDRAIRGDDIELWGDPLSRKEIVYVKDFVQIVERCIDVNSEGGFYNVGCGAGVTLEEQIDGIIDVFSKGKKSRIIRVPKKPNSPQFILDISKSIDELGYTPNYAYISYLKDFKKEMEREPFSKLWGVKTDFVL